MISYLRVRSICTWRTRRSRICPHLGCCTRTELVPTPGTILGAPLPWLRWRIPYRRLCIWQVRSACCISRRRRGWHLCGSHRNILTRPVHMPWSTRWSTSEFSTPRGQEPWICSWCWLNCHHLAGCTVSAAIAMESCARSGMVAMVVACVTMSLHRKLGCRESWEGFGGSSSPKLPPSLQHKSSLQFADNLGQIST